MIRLPSDGAEVLDVRPLRRAALSFPGPCVYGRLRSPGAGGFASARSTSLERSFEHLGQLQTEVRIRGQLFVALEHLGQIAGRVANGYPGCRYRGCAKTQFGPAISAGQPREPEQHGDGAATIKPGTRNN